MKLETFKELDLTENLPAQTIQEAIRRSDSNLGRLLEEPCKECNQQQVYCGHVDLGGIDYYDNFWHLCLSCLDAKHSETITSSGCESEGDTDCPYCDNRW